jgi:flagellar biosynthesis protein FlhG
MPDQADNLRELIDGAPAAAPVFASGPPMVLVTGGRAGAGTTTVAVNLATVLADAGNRLLLVEAARERSNLADVAGVNWLNVDRTISDVLAGTCSAPEAFAAGPAGTRVLAHRAGRRSSPQPSRHAQQRLLSELQLLGSEFDLVVVDLGSGLTSWSRRFWLQAQLVLLVTTTDSSALLDSYAMIKRSVADGAGPRIRLVVNQCDDDRVAAGAHRRLSECCQRFLGHAVPAVPSLPRHVDGAGIDLPPRVWEAPNTSFGHSMLWLGRAVDEILSQRLDSCATACGARDRVQFPHSTARC